MKDSFFSSSKGSDISELKAELSEMNREKQRSAVQRVIGLMTTGVNVSALFPDMLNCVHSPLMDVKKLVYLFVSTYARSNPDLCILAVNSFRKDAMDSNPLIRALAIRSMSCIRQECMLEYLLDVLSRGAKDSDPYVRKTAALGIAKTYRSFPIAVKDQGLLVVLVSELLVDSNPAVVVNSAAGLSELMKEDIMLPKLAESSLSFLLSALAETTEWGQIIIIDFLSLLSSKNHPLPSSSLERLIPFLSHGNSAVVLSTVRLVLLILESCKSAETVRSVCKKLTAPLVTLLAAEESTELQYVALKNIAIVAARRPAVFSGHTKPFFIRYADAGFVKSTKLSLLVSVATESEIDEVLAELKEAATEIDQYFAKEAVRGIGTLAKRMHGKTNAEDKCVAVLLEILETPSVGEEAFIALRYVLHAEPRYGGVVGAMLNGLAKIVGGEEISRFTTLQSSTREGLAWVLSEFSDKIENGIDSFWGFLGQSLLTPPILTSIVRFSLKSPSPKTQSLLSSALQEAIASETPDLRDKGFFYWRLLALGVEVARQVACGNLKKSTRTAQSEQGLADMAGLVGTLASVYQDNRIKFINGGEEAAEEAEDDGVGEGGVVGGVEGVVVAAPGRVTSVTAPTAASPTAVSAAREPVSPYDSASSSSSEDYGEVKKFLVLKPETAGSKGVKGLKIAAGIGGVGSEQFLSLTIGNFSSMTFEGPFAVQFNKNAWGWVPVGNGVLRVRENLKPGNFFEKSVKFESKEMNKIGNNFQAPLQVALRTNQDIFYFAVPVQAT